jgi:hypothetical protein
MLKIWGCLIKAIYFFWSIYKRRNCNWKKICIGILMIIQAENLFIVSSFLLPGWITSTSSSGRSSVGWTLLRKLRWDNDMAVCHSRLELTYFIQTLVYLLNWKLSSGSQHLSSVLNCTVSVDLTWIQVFFLVFRIQWKVAMIKRLFDWLKNSIQFYIISKYVWAYCNEFSL